MASKPMKIKRGKEGVNRLWKLKERSSKSMRVIRDKKEVNGLGKPME